MWKDMIAALRALDFKQFNEIVSQLDMLEFDAGRLLVFVVGFLVITGINIYFWVVRGK